VRGESLAVPLPAVIGGGRTPVSYICHGLEPGKYGKEPSGSAVVVERMKNREEKTAPFAIHLSSRPTHLVLGDWPGRYIRTRQSSPMGGTTEVGPIGQIPTTKPRWPGEPINAEKSKASAISLAVRETWLCIC